MCSWCCANRPAYGRCSCRKWCAARSASWRSALAIHRRSVGRSDAWTQGYTRFGSRWSLTQGYRVGLRRLNAHDADEFFDRVRRPLQGRPLIARQFELDDLLGAARPELDRHADKETLDAVLALEPDSAGQD